MLVYSSLLELWLSSMVVGLIGCYGLVGLPLWYF
jgi:hypothetical protein